MKITAKEMTEMLEKSINEDGPLKEISMSGGTTFRLGQVKNPAGKIETRYVSTDKNKMITYPVYDAARSQYFDPTKVLMVNAIANLSSIGYSFVQWE